MRLSVRHVTHYAYEGPPRYLVQRLHLEPAEFKGQRNLSWKISAPGIEQALRYRDGFGNWIHLVTSSPTGDSLEIVAEGDVETTDTAGVVRGLKVAAPDGLFLRTTPATTPSPAMLQALSDYSAKAPVLETAHRLMDFIQERVTYATGTSHAETTAAQAFEAGQGVCQDHAHIMIAMARSLGIPARYVTGYLVTGVGASSTAAHAWAELAVPDLGWVGFDPANAQCPTDAYVRVAAGLDASVVAPVRGSRRGGHGAERLSVEVRVEISQQ
jgi:transglutaminase-like putative cysteine protease